MLKNNHGITLVSLTVAIAVLSILAVILTNTINIDDTITRSQNALNQTYNSQNKVQSSIENINRQWGNIINNRDDE